MPTFSVYFNDGSELASKVSAKIKAEFDGNASAYFRELAEKAFGGDVPQAQEDGPLVAIARQFRSDLADGIKEAISSRQASEKGEFREIEFLGRLLDGALRYLRRLPEDRRASDVELVNDFYLLLIGLAQHRSEEVLRRYIAHFIKRQTGITPAMGLTSLAIEDYLDRKNSDSPSIGATDLTGNEVEAALANAPRIMEELRKGVPPPAVAKRRGKSEPSLAAIQGGGGPKKATDPHAGKDPDLTQEQVRNLKSAAEDKRRDIKGA